MATSLNTFCLFFFSFFSSSEFKVLLEVTLLIVGICNADFFHLSVCWRSRMKSALFIMRGRRKWSADKRTAPRTSHPKLYLATLHDIFLKKCPPLLREQKNPKKQPRRIKIGHKGGSQILEQGGGKQQENSAMSVNNARASSTAPKSQLFDKINPEVSNERPARHACDVRVSEDE